MTHTTQPGTLPHRVVAHLRTLPPGTKVPTPVLAEALGCDAPSLSMLLETPRKHGVLAAERATTQGRPLLWSLGDGNPAGPAGDDEQPPRTVSAAAPAEVPRVPLFPGVAETKAPATETKAPERETPAAMRGTRVAVWSSGELAIETADETFVFDKDVAREVIAFLKRVEVPA